MAVEGVDGVRVEILAKRLKVTKGSFYWHFKDRQALLDAMLDTWRRRATLAVIDHMETLHELASVRIASMLQVPFRAHNPEEGVNLELSIRQWGLRDERALSVLSEVDNLRLRYIGALLEKNGTPPEDAKAKAVVINCFMRVVSALAPTNETHLLAKCEACLLSGGPARR